MIQHVYERAAGAGMLDEVVVATDDVRIRDAVVAFGGKVVMTSPDHTSGTDRVAEVAKDSDARIIVNIQGDEPLIDPAVIHAAVKPLYENSSIEMGTLACPLSPDEVDNRNIVKVVFDSDQTALYFSRAVIPYIRPGMERRFAGNLYWQHIGLYVFRRKFLLRFTGYQQTRLEILEGLEQLRALEHGHNIHVEPTEYRSISVDTPEDLQKVRNSMSQTSEAP